MQATDQFKMRIEPQVKKILSSLAKREGRSQSNMVKTLILKEYQAVKMAERTTQPDKELSPA